MPGQYKKENLPSTETMDKSQTICTISKESIMNNYLQLSEILDSISDGFYAVDRNWRLTYANKRAVDYLGLPSDEIIGKNIWKKFPILLGTIHEKNHRQVMNSGQPLEYEFQHVLNNRWYHFRIYPSRYGISVFWQDITEHKQVEISLKKSEDRYRNLVESTSDYIWETDSEGLCTYASPQIFNILGYKPEELIGKTPFDLMPAQEAKRILPIFQQCVSKGTPIHNLEYMIYHKDGHLVTLENNGIPFFDAKGNIQGYRGIDRDVTRRKEMQEALRQSEERLRQYFHLGLVGMAIESPAGEWVEVNNRLCEIFGYTRDEFMRVRLRDLVHPDDFPTFPSEFDRMLQGQIDNYYLNKRYVRKDGGIIHAIISGGCSRHPDGKVKSIFVLVVDITERKQAEESLRESERKYRDLFDNMTEAFILAEPVFDETRKIKDFHLLEVNRAFERLSNIPLNKLINKNFSSLLPSSNEPHNQVQQFLNKIDLNGKPTIIEVFDQVLNRWIRFYFYYPSEDKIAIILSDITDRKKAEIGLARAKDELEEKVKERTQQLADSEEKYRLLVENANEAVFVLQDDRFQFVNNKAFTITGYSQEELLQIPFLEIIFPQDRRIIKSRYQKLLAAQKYPSYIECRIIHRDSNIRWIAANIAPIIWERKPAVLGMITDITDNKRMELALKDYAQKITRVQEEERKRIAYELHDDTCQYLSILKLQLDSLLSSGKIQSPEILKKLEYLEKDAGRAVDDVRRYSHELRPGVLEHLGLQAALEQIAEDINKLGDFKVKVEVDGKEADLSEDVKLGFFRIAQEALNNIRKHAKAGEALIVLKFQKYRMCMLVIDNGVGFDVKDSQVKSRLKGSLGLMSMQERADLIGARLKIESRPGKGTTVRVDIAL